MSDEHADKIMAILFRLQRMIEEGGELQLKITRPNLTQVRREAFDEAIEVVKDQWQQLLYCMDPGIKDSEGVAKGHINIIIEALTKARN